MTTLENSKPESFVEVEMMLNIVRCLVSCQILIFNLIIFHMFVFLICLLIFQFVIPECFNVGGSVEWFFICGNFV